MLPSVYVSVMNAYRYKNIDFPLGSFDLAKEILTKKLTPSMGGYVGTSMRNCSFHDFSNRRRSATMTIWGRKRVDCIEINHSNVWRRHWWIRRHV